MKFLEGLPREGWQRIGPQPRAINIAWVVGLEIRLTLGFGSLSLAVLTDNI